MWLPSVSGLMLVATEFKFPVIGESAQLLIQPQFVSCCKNAVGQSHGVLAPSSAACAVGQAFPAGRQAGREPVSMLPVHSALAGWCCGHLPGCPAKFEPGRLTPALQAGAEGLGP